MNLVPQEVSDLMRQEVDVCVRLSAHQIRKAIGNKGKDTGCLLTAEGRLKRTIGDARRDFKFVSCAERLTDSAVASFEASCCKALLLTEL